MASEAESLLRAVMTFKSADTEFRRAENAWRDADSYNGEAHQAADRLNRAGTRFAVAKSKMFLAAERVRANAKPTEEINGE